ncbi:MAG: flavodoxin [Lachnospiraceae bacterium]|nr:flavodoxin [Lachnospiraceae bacterium]
MKTLVAYFSAQGHTKKVAEELAARLGADIFEIVPEEPYTEADIKWTNPVSRCNKEKMGKKDVPVSGNVENFADYEKIYLGFPIWYWGAPNVINTFCKGYDWTGKEVKVFATSGGSDIGKTIEKLSPYIEGASSADGKVVKSVDEIEA